MKKLVKRLMPKTTLNKVNLALTGLFCVMLAGMIYMKSVNAKYGIPDCPPPDGTIVFIAIPDACSHYFDCTSGFPVLEECPPGLYFNPVLLACDFSEDPETEFNCNLAGKKKCYQTMGYSCSGFGSLTFRCDNSPTADLCYRYVHYCCD
ncbi:MAG: chitin binding domain-containing protein [Rikenellaceae bacterium]|nr:chitin binding domain-containing protein [Rikenellaceae bacterium]MCL2693273.1 chitin binding domain-containing protein [Rikenellaceae bacterium]